MEFIGGMIAGAIAVALGYLGAEISKLIRREQKK